MYLKLPTICVLPFGEHVEPGFVTAEAWPINAVKEMLISTGRMSFFTLYFYNHLQKLEFDLKKPLMNYFACPKSPYRTVSGHSGILYTLVIVHILNKCSIKVSGSYTGKGTMSGFC